MLLEGNIFRQQHEPVSSQFHAQQMCTMDNTKTTADDFACRQAEVAIAELVVQDNCEDKEIQIIPCIFPLLML